MNNYYFILMLSTFCFVIGTVVQKIVQQNSGKDGVSFSLSIVITIECGLLGAVFLFLLNGGTAIKLYPYTIVMAILSTLFSNASTPLMFKALGCSDVTAVKLFTTIGCMLLPYLFGIIGLNETVSIVQILGLIILIAALAIPIVVDMKNNGIAGTRKNDYRFYLYCTLICIVCSISTIIDKLYWVVDDYGHNTAQEYVLVCYFSGALIAGIIAIVMIAGKKWTTPVTGKMKAWTVFLIYAGLGVTGAFAGYLSNTCTAVLPASVMNPLSTGLNLILTTLMAWIVFKERPTKIRAISIVATIVAVAMVS